MDASDGKLTIDASKTLAVLDVFCDCFLRVLNCMDSADGAALEKILFEEMAPEDDFVRQVVELVQAKEAGPAQPRRPERGCSCHPSWSLPLCGVCQPCA